MDKETKSFLGLGCGMVVLVVVANLTILAGGVFLVIKVLQWTGVLPVAE